ncbi:hypothetical protein [Flavobacterium litorale]|uniref:Zinc-ribbon 15 domain-containing protein n=1 Tax=Flavobacterium litorale TaxID=2856519 RepID=A0ABX8VE43_9FLAO|nr:hypothetical protein [Flavobacterium litorale]QYJ68906.1 hypothetical protein K1I41_03210 [Flavobacterium litorale]
MQTFYGMAGRVIAKKNVNRNCNKCNACNSIQLEIIQYYHYLFWMIPTYPTKERVVAISCTKCEHLPITVPKELDKIANDFKATAKTPWWMYLGILLIFVFTFVRLKLYIDESIKP